MDKTGTLVLVATPIGNLGDISQRAADTLRDADVIYCEDTRHSRRLLTHLEIRGQELVSLHEHNEAERIRAVLERLASGQTVALISDAGMPLISDPGQRLAAAATVAGHIVTAIPGPNAALMALAISGLATDRFHFEGFLPLKNTPRKERIEALAQLTEPTVLYEAPQRVARTVADLLEVCGRDRSVAIARELTKLHEEVWRGDLAGAEPYLQDVPPRGEYCIVLGGAIIKAEVVSDDQIAAALHKQIANGLSKRDAVAAVCRQLGLPRRRVYSVALNL